MKQILIFLISFLFFTVSYSQQPSSFTKPDLIYLNGFSWKQGDKKLSATALQKEIFKTKDAIPFYKKGKTNTFISEVFFTGGILFSIATISNSHGSVITNNNRRISYTILAVSSFIASTITLKLALKNKGKAVHLRNLDMLNH